MSTNNENDLVEAVLIHGPEILSDCLSIDQSIEKYLSRIDQEKLLYPTPLKEININQWYMPLEYSNMDIEGFLINICPKENYNRLIKELELYQVNEMIPVLRMMKYIVDTLRKNGIVWGVGRGSSVASYVLFLLGVHKIDSVKYNLPIEEFFKEKQNG
jgi:DNA polymerase III alpha subunit